MKFLKLIRSHYEECMRGKGGAIRAIVTVTHGLYLVILEIPSGSPFTLYSISVSVLGLIFLVECEMSPNVIKSHRMLPNGTEYHRMTPNGTECHRMAPNVTNCHQMAPNVTECHQMSPNVIKRCSASSPVIYCSFI